jgi:hypothetical protein
MNRFVYRIGLSFSNQSLVSPHSRATWDEAWIEGSQIARAFAQKGMEVKVSVMDLNVKNHDFTYSPKIPYPGDQ